MTPRTKKNWRKFKEAREFVRNQGLQNFREWRKYVVGGLPDKPELPDDIPKAPNDVYIDEFEGFADWLGKEKLGIPMPRRSPSENVRSDKPVYLNYYEARKFLIERKIKTPSIYRSTVRNHSKRIPEGSEHHFGQL